MPERTPARVWIRTIPLLIGTAFKADAIGTVLVLLLAPVAGAIAAVTAIGLQQIVNAAAAADLTGMLAAAALLAGTVVVGNFTGTITADLRIRLQQRVGMLLDQRIVTMCAGLPHLDHHEHPPYQDKLELLRTHRNWLGSAFGALVENVRAIVAFSATLALLMSLRPQFLLLLFLALPMVVAARRSEKIIAQTEEMTAAPTRLRRGLFGLAVGLDAAKELRVYGLRQEIAARHRELREEIDGHRRWMEIRTAIWTASGWLIFGCGVAAALYVIGTAALRGQATPGDVILTLAMCGQLTGSVSGLIQMFTWMQQAVRAVGHYLWLADHATTRMSGEPAEAVPPVAGGDVVLDQVSFGYPDAARPVLQNVSLRLPAGKTVAIVGENGAGKTTLVKLLCRMYDPTEGRITYGGADLGSFGVEAWRTKVTACFQDYCRLEFLLVEAVGVGDLSRIDDEEAVRFALDQAGGGGLPDLLPRGLRTQLGATFPDGTDLSGGQWQKLALGRASMRGAPVLRVLDEPAANLDPAAEFEIFSRFQAAARETGDGAITVFVSHRFATVRTADLIVVLDEGTVKELGSHDELMAQDGLYATLYRLHAKGYQDAKPTWGEILDESAYESARP
ncbi:ABC transporter ATP-binding protein [Nonomuraea sp. NPDC050643]|uniref:ABC transporter ATP-binding protein n=1 Tax=Nonomuraea sp. NPDC050643 TaxID=3155660 RepID=UPI00340D557A